MAPYKYAPLNEDTEIRLLTLLPDWFEAPIHISLEINVLSDGEVPEFEALSYVWGDASDLLDIFLETSPSKRPELRETDDIDSIEWRTLRVTKNLFEALKHLRLEDRPRVLWIDAICVDQQNLEERGHQVLRMPNIYTSAKGVIVWLGPESDDTAIAMNAIQDLGSRITVDWDLQTMAPASESDFDPDSEKSYGAVEPSPQVWRSIHNLLGRAWFERLWIIQEVCLAGKNTHVVCGSVKISYEHFGNGICYLLNWKDVDNSQVEGLWDMVEQLLVLSNKTTFSDLDWVLAQTRQSQCSDQRDRIYAILSLVPEQERLEIHPDYTISVAEVFQSVVLQQARCRSQLNVLRFCSMDNRIMDLPTWVPDWSVSSSIESFRILRADAATKAYPCSESEGVLAATGIWITVVDDIKKHFTDNIPHTRYASAKGIGELISAVVGGEISDRRVDKLRSLCRTLCAAEFREMSTPANPDFPFLEESLKYIMDCDDWLRQNSTKPPRPHSSYMAHVNGFSSGRVLVTSADGRLGLAPRATKPGDKICVILGCSSPLVLRSDDNGFSHKVVGECYLDGIMTGEALLGELPKEWTMLQKYYPEYLANYWLFLDSTTGQTHVDDPRLGPLPAGWRYKSHKEEDAWNWFVNDGTGEDTVFDPRLEPDMLKARGVELHEFRLI
ncbi:MAG: hypothetical protein L6R38_003431 [Xanthoria sp. 2 TBL-2021]|nr:MAG: hypothetical protein L6R38_003431 [Xanthoria sp. 2 TBL-2021]